MTSPNKLVVLIVFVLFGSVSCQYGTYYPSPPAYPPPAPSTPSPPSYSPSPATPPTYSPPAPSTSPPPVYTPPATPPTYPPPAPSTPPPSVYPPPATPPTNPPPAPSTPSPSIYSPPPATPPTYPPPAPSTPPPSVYPPPTTPPTYPPPAPSTPPPPVYSPPATPPTYPPPSPSPSPPTSAPVPAPVPAYPPPPTPMSPTPSPSSPAPTPTPPPSPGAQLKVGYYKNKCGAYVDVEAIVKKHVNGTDPGMQAGLIRLFFHDCFVRGCDGSILLDKFSNGTRLTPDPEKLGIPNFPSLRGYEVINATKTEIEAKCPGKVSCADIVAFAARDASYFLSGGNINFAMPAGRYDGNVSLASETLPNLPPPFAGYDQLVNMFADKGLDATDMVTLSGAHSVGRSHCSSFRDRLPPRNTSDSMDKAFAAMVQGNCSSPSGNDNTVVQDFKTPNVLDNQYYKNVLAREVLFTSDAALTTNSTANNLVRAYAGINPYLWHQKFAKAMVKMGGVEVKTAANGEIRKMCDKTNS